MSGGWVKLHRSAEDHPVLQNATRRGLFDRLLLRASREARRVNWRGKTFHLDAGQLIISVRDFSVLNDVGYKEVRNHLTRLVKENMLRMDAIQGAGTGATGTLITICNYCKFQLRDETEGAAQGATPGATGAQVGRNRGAQNKKEENLENPSPNGEGAEAPEPDLARVVWNRGIQLLGVKNRSLIGKARKDLREDDAKLFDVLKALERKIEDSGLCDPVEWFIKAVALKAAPPKAPGGDPMRFHRAEAKRALKAEGHDEFADGFGLLVEARAQEIHHARNAA
jgi:hypothetical protein